MQSSEQTQRIEGFSVGELIKLAWLSHGKCLYEEGIHKSHQAFCPLFSQVFFTSWVFQGCCSLNAFCNTSYHLPSFWFFFLKLSFLTWFLTVVHTKPHICQRSWSFSLGLSYYYIANTEAVVFYLKDPMQTKTRVGFVLLFQLQIITRLLKRLNIKKHLNKYWNVSFKKKKKIQLRLIAHCEIVNPLCCPEFA